jgi:hypothetical protein
MTISHLVSITDLTPGTTQYFRVMSSDGAGNLVVSDEHIFTTLEAPAPATAFTSTKLSISPSEVNIGETVSISVLITNTGNTADSYEITLKINGVVQTTKNVALNAGASEEVTFTTAKDVAGNYTVDANGLSGSFTVKEAPAPPPPAPVINWPLIWGVIGGGVLVIGAIFFFVVRRDRDLRIYEYE